MLHEFLIANRGEVLDRARAKLAKREVPTPTKSELTDGLPLFVDQLIAILSAAEGTREPGHRIVAESAA